MLKKPVKEILSPKVISIITGAPVSKAVSLMDKNNISCIVVIQNKKPVGMLTERDIVQALYRGKTHVERCMVEELMSKPVLTAKGDIDIYETYNLLAEKGVRHLVIVNSKDEVIGVVTQSDIMNNLAMEYFLEIKNIKKLMTRTVITVEKGDLLKDAVAKMAEHSISCIIVEEDGYPVGIITERDITSLFRNGIDLEAIKSEEIMSKPVKTISLNTHVYDATKIMKKKDIRRLVVVDKKGKILGLLTQSDIIKGLEGRYIESLKEIIRLKEEILQETKRNLVEKTVYLDNILRSSTDMAIAATDLDFHIIYYNPVAEKIFGYKAEEVIGQTVMEMHTKEKVSPARFESAIETVRKEGEYNYTVEQRNNGGTRFLESRVSGIWDYDDNLVGFVLMSRDVTKRKEAERALRKAHDELEKRVEERTAELKNAYEELKVVDELKTNILANVSHELRTPISITNSALEVALDEKNPEERNRLLKMALDALARQDFIVGNLIEAASVERRDNGSKLKAVDMAKIITHSYNEFKPRIARNKINMVVNMGEKLPKVRAEYEQLRRVMHNLIDNAIKFNKEGGEISIEARRKEDMIEVCINDTGIGIPKNKLGKIFDQFYQVDSSMGRYYQGAGMGLAIVKAIIESYSGRIKVESEMDKGSSFCFTLPISEG